MSDPDQMNTDPEKLNIILSVFSFRTFTVAKHLNFLLIPIGSSISQKKSKPNNTKERPTHFYSAHIKKLDSVDDSYPSLSTLAA
jgi:hypothetical protein